MRLIGKISDDVDLFTNRKPFLKYDVLRSLVYLIEFLLQCTVLESYHFYSWLEDGDPFIFKAFAVGLYIQIFFWGVMMPFVAVGKLHVH